ncbi:hypothetical protein RIF29_05933 [Crotalaria pallida]|uniref:Uncharacterized protein n=1 Tax=Crotalaria pallida TaxID=3830 RepID=A0AAN9PB79_CROPI
MRGMKKWLFKRLRKKFWKCTFLRSAFHWKRLHWPPLLMNNVIFKIMFTFETIVLVLMLSFFYLCFGCSF